MNIFLRLRDKCAERRLAARLAYFLSSHSVMMSSMGGLSVDPLEEGLFLVLPDRCLLDVLGILVGGGGIARVAGDGMGTWAVVA